MEYLKNAMDGIFYDNEFCKLFDARSDAYNILSEKMGELGIDHAYIKNLVLAVEELERFKMKYSISSNIK